MPVRTARLAVGASGAADTVKQIYTCPAGRTAIIKDVRLASVVTGGQQTAMSLNSGPTFVTVLNGSVPQNAFSITPTPYWVLEPGDHLDILTPTAGGVHYWVSGVELDGVAP